MATRAYWTTCQSSHPAVSKCSSNAAGIYPPTTLADATVENYRRIVEGNVLGTLSTTATAVEYLPAHSKDAAVVNFASVDALTVSPGQEPVSRC